MPDKPNFLEELNYVYNSIQNTYSKLLENGSESEAAKLESTIITLSALIEDAVNGALEEWMAKAGKLEKESKETLSNVSRYAEEIKMNIENSERLIKSITYVDKTLEKLLRLLS